MLKIILADGEVAHLIRVVLQNQEDGTGAIHCTVVRDNWDFQEVVLDGVILDEHEPVLRVAR
jgi:hypothetical protein